MKAQGFGPLVMAIMSLLDEGLITKETAAVAASRILAELDVEYDVIEELEKATAEQDEAEQDRMASINGQLLQRLAQNGNPEGAPGVQPEAPPNNPPSCLDT